MSDKLFWVNDNCPFIDPRNRLFHGGNPRSQNVNVLFKSNSLDFRACLPVDNRHFVCGHPSIDPDYPSDSTRQDSG